MSTHAKPTASSPTSPTLPAHREKGIRIFMWPKVIFLYPTAIVALICWAGMWASGDRTHDPTKPLKSAVAQKHLPKGSETLGEEGADITRVDRFKLAQNLLGVLFLGMLGFNLLVMALDFPRFTLLAVILGIAAAVSFVGFLSMWLDWSIWKPIHFLFGHVYVVANKWFYLMTFFMLMLVFLIIYATRWLDYWEVLPNEILHHHGPLGDLERYPTMNLKFDKEITDVLEWLLLGAGRLVLHVPNVPKAMVLDNVILITSKEEALKKVMSRLEVRVTSDQEVGETTT